MANFMSACIAGMLVRWMHEAVAHIRNVTGREPRVAVVLGSGLGAFADELADPIAIPYSEIPGWPASTAAGHSGKLVFGKLGKLDVAVMAGRAHLYEGYTPAQVTMGVRVLHRLGARSCVYQRRRRHQPVL
jgi:purine-nucleoside phosphorylase